MWDGDMDTWIKAVRIWWEQRTWQMYCQGEAAESKPALKNACWTDFIFCQEKDDRCNDKQMLQPNRTVKEQGLSFRPLAALLWNSANVMCDIFCIPWTVTSSVSDDRRWYNWDNLGAWKNKRAVADIFAKYRTLSPRGVPMGAKNQI